MEIISKITSEEKYSKFYKCKSSNNTNMLPGDLSGSPDESFILLEIENE